MRCQRTRKSWGYNMKRVMAFGTYDLLHPGHEYFLNEARQHGDELIVVIARDQTVRKIKHRPPVHSEEKRRRALEALPFVDRAVLGSTGDKMQIIADFRPDVICLGYDQTHFVDKLYDYIRAHALTIDIVRIDAYKPDEFKSSLLRERSQHHN
jgi:FAD synthetase